MKKQKLYVILHAKLYNIPDFDMWFKWYTKFIKSDFIIIINDDSIINIYDEVKKLKTKYNFNNVKIIDFKSIKYDPQSLLDNQTYNYNYVIQNELSLNINDVILIPDDDEFWWYDTTKFTSFLNCVNHEKKLYNTDCLLLANILMCNNIYLEHRNNIDNFNDISKYRCNLITCEHKPIVFYNNKLLKYIHTGTENSYIIGNNYIWDNSAGSAVLYDYHLRLYHYRLTTNEEYKRKMSHCAIKTDLVDNFRYFAAKEIGNFMENSYPSDKGIYYNTLDLTISNELGKI